MATQIFENEWSDFKNWWQRNRGPSSEDGNELVENPFFNAAMRMNNTILVVVDLTTLQYLYFSGDPETVMGWPREIYVNGGVQASFRNIFPADVQATATYSKIINDFYSELSAVEKTTFRAFWDIRFLRSDGKQIVIRLQDAPLKNDSSGNMIVLYSMLTDITSLKTGERRHLRLAKGNSNRLYEFDPSTSVLTELQVPSDREIETFSLIQQGYGRKEVAEKMNISLATVKSHCQNTFDKLRTSDSLETIGLLQSWGML